MKKITVAATQMACSWDRQDMLDKAEGLVRKAAGKGANIILLQELFETPYFCQLEETKHFALATTVAGNPAIKRFQEVAKELKVVIPVSFFEKAGNVFFNAIVVIDADGSILGKYRKTHIPDGICYEEKYYFSPGDTGFQVFKTKYANIGIGICWDQWFPETARCLALLGAEILLFPTAIGSDPMVPKSVKKHWQQCMQGHAAANLMPVVASNRIGRETAGESEMTFFGGSFIADEEGSLVEEALEETETVLVHEFDLDAIAERRYYWAVFRDRRPEKYGAIMTMDSSI
jgi:N-carbamoylputrescine amidase